MSDYLKDQELDEMISPVYKMELAKKVNNAIWQLYSSYAEVIALIQMYHHTDDYGNYPNFNIYYREQNTKIDLLATLRSMAGSLLVKVAVDVGVDTPDYIPVLPQFKLELKADYKNAYDAFSKASKQVYTDPDLAIGIANSALESIIKEILKDQRLAVQLDTTHTLYQLTRDIISTLKLNDENHPIEVKTICRSLLPVNQAIEQLRSTKTNMHGKSSAEKVIEDPVVATFILNSVSTVGLFLIHYYKRSYPKAEPEKVFDDDLPF